MNKRTTYEAVLKEQGFLIYTTSGGSMRPFLRSGQDLVRIEAKGERRCEKLDVVLYRSADGRYVLHRIVRVLPDSYTICGDNCWRLERGITDDQILGVLTTIIRDGKPIDINAPAYRRRIRLWCALYIPRAAVIYTRGILWKLWNKLRRKYD